MKFREYLNEMSEYATSNYELYKKDSKYYMKDTLRNGSKPFDSVEDVVLYIESKIINRKLSDPELKLISHLSTADSDPWDISFNRETNKLSINPIAARKEASV